MILPTGAAGSILKTRPVHLKTPKSKQIRKFSASAVPGMDRITKFISAAKIHVINPPENRLKYSDIWPISGSEETS